MNDIRCIDADALLTDRKKSKYYHIPNGDIAIPLVDIEHAPTIEPEWKNRKDEIIGYAIDKYKNDLINEITKQVEIVFRHHGYILTASEVIKLIKEFNGGEYK